MRKIFVTLLFMVLSGVVAAQNITVKSAVVDGENDNRLKLVQEYLGQYPKATLIDVYKWCFQSVYGPAHLAENMGELEGRLRIEIESLTDRTPSSVQAMPAYEYIGFDKKYVRVNLLLVHAGAITVEHLVDALNRTILDAGNPMPVEQWYDEWTRIAEDLQKIEPPIERFEEDNMAIMKQLENGNVVMHHSKQFNEAYDVHYRVISAEIFENEILPLIKF